MKTSFLNSKLIKSINLELKQVEKATYLGGIINKDASRMDEINNRLNNIVKKLIVGN